ncbi:N-acetyltransferase [Paenibacillus anaericanus]|uniref:N-acetyltransferase n=1 Tax=Paenibacillus anaericanus TaxID=170367 RepID=A0A3S1DID1_9BACL|nr:GNAT family protein [Paenibacillus anaericanus]RUT45496.1 N-acetyltransferase [Paenibacillus anaericanus]
MTISLQPYVDETVDLIAFLTGQVWPFHGTATITETTAREQIENGRYDSGTEHKTFWIIKDDSDKVGLLRVYDLEDPTPLFDIRIGERHSGQGYGLQAVKKLVEYIFTNYDDKIRIEGNTRADNFAMRKTFHNAGFVKEAVHRQSWPSEDGRIHDSIGYAILRGDWMEGTTTQIDWTDFPY